MSKQYSTIIAVDPGANGAAATFDIDGRLEWVDNYENIDSVIDALRPASGTNALVVIEKVHASPMMSPSTAYSFGQYTRDWYAVARVLGLDLLEVTPQQWQAPLKLPAIEDRGAHKRSLRDIARRLYPEHHSVTLINADALLIGHWALGQKSRLSSLVEKQNLSWL